MTSCRKCGACCSRVGFAGWSSPTPVSSIIVQSEKVSPPFGLWSLLATSSVLRLIPFLLCPAASLCVSWVPLKACTRFCFRRCVEWLKWALLLESLFLSQDLNLDYKTLMKTRCPPLHSVYTSLLSFKINDRLLPLSPALTRSLPPSLLPSLPPPFSRDHSTTSFSQTWHKMF